MRTLLSTFAVLTLVSSFSLAVSATGSEAREQRKPTPVTIAPRFLSAGTLVSPGEYRGEVTYADARFIPVSRELAGRDQQYVIDPWYVPGKRGVSFDFGMFSSKRPGEH